MSLLAFCQFTESVACIYSRLALDDVLISLAKCNFSARCGQNILPFDSVVTPLSWVLSDMI